MGVSQVSPTTRRYSPEFKERAVRMVRELRRETGQEEGARRDLEAARSIWEPLVQANPRVTDYRDVLARCLYHLGHLRRDS